MLGEFLAPGVSAGPKRLLAPQPVGPEASWPLGGWGGGSAFLQLELPLTSSPAPSRTGHCGAEVSRRDWRAQGIQGPLRRHDSSAQKCLEWLAN